MTTKRFAPLLLAASVFMTGATGLYISAMTPAHAITSVDELSDVSRNHWAYDALRDLVEKYDVIEGYPSGVFRGDKAATRWELAAALNSLIKAMGRDLARLGSEKADKADLETLARLQEEFRSELAALNARVTDLENRATAIEAKNAEQDNRLSLLERTQIHGDMSFGGLADISSDGTGTGRDGISDALSAVARLRLTLDVPVKEDEEDSLLGRGDVHARLVGAIGRVAPAGYQSGNLGSGTTFFGYSRIAGDASVYNETPFSLANGGNTRTNFYIENMHYKQNLKAGIPLLTDWFINDNEDEDWKTTGDFYAGIVPWRYLYDKSPYRGNENLQFQNVALVNTPGIAVNYNMPMIAYQWHQGLGRSANLDITGSVGSIDIGNVYDGLNVSYEARLNYQTAFLGPDATVPGALYAGGYHIFQAGNRLLSASVGAPIGRGQNSLTGYMGQTGDANDAYYVGWNQQWFGGIGTTVNWHQSTNTPVGMAYTALQQPLGIYNPFGAGPTITTQVRKALSGVLSIPVGTLLAGHRPNDVIGIGYANADFYENNADLDGTYNDKNAHIWEAFYRWQVNDAFSVVPSFQYIRNRLGMDANNNAYVIGLRTNYVF